MDNNQNYNNGIPAYNSYGQGMPAAYPAVNAEAVPYEEKKKIRKHLSGTFNEALVYSVGSFVLAQLIFIVMMMCGYKFREAENGAQIMDIPYNIAGTVPSLLFCIGIFIFDKCRSRTRLSDYFETDYITFKGSLAFFGMIMFSYCAATIVQTVTVGGCFAAGFSPIAEDYIPETELSGAYIAVEVLMTGILPPIAEELMFRGVILRRLSCVSQTFGIFVSALIFGMMHGNLIQAELGFIVGIVLGYTAVKTGSLILPIAGHMFVNLTAVSSDLVELITDEETSDTYWTLIIIVFGVIGLVALIVSLAGKHIHFPKVTDYHKKRGVPVMLTSVSFWIMMLLFIVEIVSKFGEVTERLKQ